MKRNSLICVVPLLFMIVSGCRPLSSVQLQRYTGDTRKVLRDWDFEPGRIIRYSHRIQWRHRELVFTGIIKQESVDVTTIAGLSNAGTTLFVARLEAGTCSVLKNRMRVSDDFLRENIIQDVKCLCLVPPFPDSLIYKPTDGKDEYWVRSLDDLGAYEAYYIFCDGEVGYARIRNDKIVLRASLVVSESEQLEQVAINNIVAGYRAKINTLPLKPGDTH